MLNGELDRLSSLPTSNRITIIDLNGKVYFDNTVDFLSLENHGTRAEVVGAREKGSHELSRTSFGMSQILLIMLIIAVVISGLSASWISKKVVGPFNKIDFENPETLEIYEEFRPFVKRIAEENFEKAQREELRQQFTANVGHELKTPLTSISGFAEILKVEKTDEATTKDFASSIYEESQRMIALVKSMKSGCHHQCCSETLRFAQCDEPHSRVMSRSYTYPFKN